MACQISWSPEAVEDIEEIASYIEKDSPSYAQAVTEQIITASRLLNHSPLIGRIVPELGEETYRELFIYRIYRVTGSQLLIVAVIHGRRLLDNVDARFK